MQNLTERIVFPQMVIEKKLKASQRGYVYLIRSEDNHTRYIYRAFSGSGEVYRKMRQIHCPHLPAILDVKEENGMVYVLEEYIQGDTLAFLMEGATLTAADAKQIIIQICYALHILHGLGAVHRDVKPENVIMRGSKAVLIDFDASRLCKAENTADTQIMGTTGYAAPEQYGFSQTDARTDIYALGILLNEMLTGQHPSRCLTEGELRPVIQKCTQINADQRYCSVVELIESLHAPVQKEKTASRIPWLLAAAVLLIVMILWQARLPQAQPENHRVPEITQAVEKSETTPSSKPLPSVKVFTLEQLEITMDPWQGPTSGHGTTFQCDMDQDGVDERYLFGLQYDYFHHDDIIYYDGNGIYPGDHPQRTIHSCIWRILDDGTKEEALAVAEHLTNVRFRIWRVDDFVSPAPDAVTTSQIWPGHVTATFFPEQNGSWMYDISADFFETELTASAMVRFEFIDPFG